MNGNAPFNGFTAATTVLKWLRTWYGNGMPDAIDLEVVRQMLPDTPYGKGVRTIKAPMELDVNGNKQWDNGFQAGKERGDKWRQ